jgi:hypothetical protein
MCFEDLDILNFELQTGVFNMFELLLHPNVTLKACIAGYIDSQSFVTIESRNYRKTQSLKCYIDQTSGI